MNRTMRRFLIADACILLTLAGGVGYALQSGVATAAPTGTVVTRTQPHHPVAPTTGSSAAEVPATAATLTNNTPDNLLALLGKRIVKKDIDGIVALHEPTATLVNYDGSLITGRAAIRAFYLDWFKSDPVLTVNPKQTLVTGGQPAAGGKILNRTASIMGTYSLTQNAADGTRETFTGNFCDVVRQQPNGKWLYLQDNPYPPH